MVNLLFVRGLVPQRTNHDQSFPEVGSLTFSVHVSAAIPRDPWVDIDNRSSSIERRPPFPGRSDEP